jgi:hypothetical protein
MDQLARALPNRARIDARIGSISSGTVAVFEILGAVRTVVIGSDHLSADLALTEVW